MAKSSALVLGHLKKKSDFITCKRGGAVIYFILQIPRYSVTTA